jgi:putative Mg2+ transporter-C (MgtC) family protein
MDIIEIITRLGIAVLLGGLVGVERTLAGKAAGMRTYALVSMGSALFVMISQDVYSVLAISGDFDPLRIASQIVVGIGFIGAGLVVYNNNKTSGLTSAAGLWVAAAIGMACGFALYGMALSAVVLTILVFTLMWKVEHFLSHYGYSMGIKKDQLEGDCREENGARR